MVFVNLRGEEPRSPENTMIRAWVGGGVTWFGARGRDVWGCRGKGVSRGVGGGVRPWGGSIQ